MPSQQKVKGLRERFADGEYVLAAEGYVFEMERRGYLQAGPFVPEVVLEHPELVRQLTREFAHAGSDITLAFTYYGHREKLRMVNRENDLERLNTEALRIAREVADETGTLMAGNICNTTCYDPKNQDSFTEVRRIFKEEVEWAVNGGADLLLAETYNDFGEAMLALEAMQKYGNGLPTVIMLAPQTDSKTRDGYTYPDACRRLEEAGADCVGLNCNFGPQTIIPAMREIRKVCKGPLAALPVGYRTTEKEPQMQSLTINGKRAFYEELDAFCCARSDWADFAKACKEIGVQYVGICCGNSSRYFRKMAETLGRTPAASRYTPDMSRHFVYGTDARLRKCNTDGLKYLYTPTENKA